MQEMDVILKYFPHLSEGQISQFAKSYDVYKGWNDQINVVSRKEFDAFYERHVLHSLAIAKFIQFQPATRVLDLGTGGGFPGVPLAILFPDVTFTLVDSIGKKIKVVNEVCHELNIQNVKAFHLRVEEVKGQFDFVVSRAVAPLSELLSWTKGKYSGEQRNALPNGLICLKGGDLKEEINAVKMHFIVERYKLSDYFAEPFFETKELVYAVKK
jgi:16S rRNA (guanine527-N7)-methyltransferase